MPLLVTLFFGLRFMTVQGAGELDISTPSLPQIALELCLSMVLSKCALHTQTIVGKHTFLLQHSLVLGFQHTNRESTFGTASMESY